MLLPFDCPKRRTGAECRRTVGADDGTVAAQHADDSGHCLVLEDAILTHFRVGLVDSCDELRERMRADER